MIILQGKSVSRKLAPAVIKNPFGEGTGTNPFEEDTAAEPADAEESKESEKAAVFSPFIGIISKCFEAHLDVYIESQDRFEQIISDF